MPVIDVTRLRLKDPALLDEFLTDAVAAIEQAQKSEGNLGADALADTTTPGGPSPPGKIAAFCRPLRATSRTWTSAPAWIITATRPRSSTGHRPTPARRTGRPAGATSLPMAKPPTSPSHQLQTKTGTSPRQSNHHPASPEAANRTYRNGLAAAARSALRALHGHH